MLQGPLTVAYYIGARLRVVERMGALARNQYMPSKADVQAHVDALLAGAYMMCSVRCVCFGCGESLRVVLV